MGGVRLNSGSPVTSDGGGSSNNNGRSTSGSGSSDSNTAVETSGGAPPQRRQQIPSSARMASMSGGSTRLARPVPILPGQGTSAASTLRARPQPARPEITNSRAMLEEAVDALIKSTARVGPLPARAGHAAGAGAASRQPSLPAPLQGPPHGGNVALPVATHGQGAGGLSGAPPGSSAQAFFTALQAIKPDPEEPGLHAAHKLHRELTCKLQSRIWGLRGGLYAQPAVPRDFLGSFDFDVQELINSMGRMSEAVDELAAQLKETAGSGGGDPGRVRALEGDVAEARERAQNAERVLAGLAGRADEDVRAIQFLKEQLRQNEMARTILQEQVNGKRSLWMNVHNDPNERPPTRESEDRAPTPSSGQTFAPPPERGYNLSIPSSLRSATSQTTGNQSGGGRSVSETVTGARVSPNRAHPSQFAPRQVAASASFHPGAPYPGGPYPGASYHGRGPSGSHASSAFQLAQHRQSAAAAHQAHYHQQLRQASNAAHSSLVQAAITTATNNNNRPPTMMPPVARPTITITAPGPGPGNTGPNNTSGGPGPATRRTPRAQTIAETGSPKEKERKRIPTPAATTTATSTTANGVPRTLLRADGTGDDAECLKWAEGFQTLFAHVHGFCLSYFYEAPRLGPDGDWKARVISEANPELWEMICRAAWGVGESMPGEHAARLLNDRESRPFLLQRLILQYVMSFVFGEGGWKEFADEVGGEVAKVDARLRVLDPSRSAERQTLLDRRTSLLTSLTSGTESGPYKNFKLTQHHQYLKTLVAPFLPNRIHKPPGPPASTSTTHPAKPPSTTSLSNEAFYDLFTITAAAWDLSSRVHSIMPSSPSRRLSLQYSWADHGVRFAADIHEPVDCRVDRRTLQLEHCRITLCTTPAVTVRVVRGEGEGGRGKVVDVNVRNILKAGVLVLRY